MTKIRFELRATNFHTGNVWVRPGAGNALYYDPSNKVLSRHHTLDAAEKALRKYRNPECVCGCAVIVEIGAEE